MESKTNQGKDGTAALGIEEQEFVQHLTLFLKDRFGVTVSSYTKYIEQMKRLYKNQKIQQKDIIDFVYRASIEELSFETSAFDDGTIKDQNQFDSSGIAPLLLEVKNFRNASKPYQRIQKTDTTLGKIAITNEHAVKKDDTFTLICHDGVRFIKLVLLMPNQKTIVRDLHERNKFLLKSGFVDSASENGTVIILVDGMDQLAIVHNDLKSDMLKEQQMAIQGLPIKYTNAPKFVFLNEHAKESGEKMEQEQEDEFADLYKAMDVHDLTGRELIYIKRWEQQGIRRKKFTNVE